MVLDMFSMSSIAEKLSDLGGAGPLKQREWRIRSRLNWHHKAASAIRHILYGERRPTVEEAKQIEAAHLKYCAEKLVQNAAENEALIQSIRAAVTAMESTDPAFYREHIEAARALLLLPGDVAGDAGGED